MPGTHVDFIGKRRIAASLSLLVILASVTAVYVRGVRLGIDFAGGMEIQVRFQPEVEVDEGLLRGVVGEVGVAAHHGTNSPSGFHVIKRLE